MAMRGEREFNRLKGVDLSAYQCNTIFVDPPRAGLDDATVQRLAATHPALGQAIEAITGERYRDFVAREVVKAEDIIDYTPHENVAERLAKRFGAGVGTGAVRALREFAPQLR